MKVAVRKGVASNAYDRLERGEEASQKSLR